MQHLLYLQYGFPIFQNRLYEDRANAVACPKGDIQLVEDLETGLVYNAAFCPEVMVFDHRYQNEQAVSPFFLQHLNRVANIIEQWMGKDDLVELGCGKGFFLEMMLSQGFGITGFDPVYEGNNPCIQKKYFEPGVISGQADGLILRHVLEHIQNPVEFLEQLKKANGGNGKIYIEVPCFDWICEHNTWFDIFYEHVNYFRLSDFYRIFDKVLCSGKAFNGQYLYVIADLSSLRKPKIDINDRVIFPGDFTASIAAFHNSKREYQAIWGGASKGVIFALLKVRAGCNISIVIDINPAKQNKYLPVTGLQVISPQLAMERLETGSTIFVMNSNYIDEIKLMSHNAFNYIGVDR